VDAIAACADRARWIARWRVDDMSTWLQAASTARHIARSRIGKVSRDMREMDAADVLDFLLLRRELDDACYARSPC
jgi:hypothetical protein